MVKNMCFGVEKVLVSESLLVIVTVKNMVSFIAYAVIK